MVDYVTARAMRIYYLAEGAVYHGPYDAYEFVLYRIYAVLSFGTSISPSQVHDAWCAWQASIRSDHWHLVPYDQLPPDVAAQDNAYALAIAQVAAEGASCPSSTHS